MNGAPVPLQAWYNWATQIRWTGKRGNAPRPWPTGRMPVDVTDSTISAETVERFWSRVDRSGGPDACWPWVGNSRYTSGYGRVWFCGKDARSHRVAYTLAVGDTPFATPRFDPRRPC
jgi:hypothetical protein